MKERREIERTNVDEVAYISGDGASLRCRAFNISEKGAAIELPTKQQMMPDFKLMLEKDRIVRHCLLVWSSGNRIGVIFTGDPLDGADFARASEP
ncbi:PilZ domain-containing protein [Bradyrhizobium sp. DASA03076]|uniref:PilZ domain-containing protein n=1 Tax=Bradyrhizobium sp. BLXBL-03 TaxID=3395916 RepID=UPI003F6F38E9